MYFNQNLKSKPIHFLNISVFMSLPTTVIDTCLSPSESIGSLNIIKYPLVTNPKYHETWVKEGFLLVAFNYLKRFQK